MEKNIYIYIDDSGKILDRQNRFSCFSAVVFSSKRAQNNFKKKYHNRLKKIRYKYCKGKNKSCKTCDNKHNELGELKCREVKGTAINRKKKYSHFKTLVDINIDDSEYKLYATVIDSERINDEFKKDAKSISRLEHYIIKKMVLRILNDLMLEKFQHQGNIVNVIVTSDQQNVASVAIRSLEDALYTDLYYGDENFKSSKEHNMFSAENLGVVEVHYCDSKRNVLIQLADLVAYNTYKVANKEYGKYMFNKKVTLMRFPG